jgi:ABC-2 type transport system permease protein
MNFLLGLTISYLAFWMDEVWTFHAIKDISLPLLSGMVFPLSALPEPFVTVSRYLPFQFMSFVPAGLMNGTLNTSDFPRYMLLSLVWIALLTAITSAVWFRGLKKYSAFGG